MWPVVMVETNMMMYSVHHAGGGWLCLGQWEFLIGEGTVFVGDLVVVDMG